MSTPPRGILPAFGLPEVNVVALSGGLSGTTWKATVARQAYVVRRHDPPGQTTATVISELAWLDALATDTSLPTSDPVRRADGELAPVIERRSNGEPLAFWTVSRWVEGESLGRLPDPREAGLIGTRIATLHGHARDWSPPPGFARPTYDAAHFALAASTLVNRRETLLDTAARRLLDDALRRGTDVLSRLGREPDEIGLIHADLHDGNIIFGDVPKRPGVIDFGRFGWGCWALDLAMALHYLDDDLISPVVDAYETGFGLTTDARRALPALRFLAALDNLAVLSAIPEEAEFVTGELSLVLGQAERLVGR